MHRAAQLLGDTRGGAKQLRHRLRVHKAAQLLGDPGGGAKQLPIWKLRGKVQRSCTLYGLVVPCSPGKALCSLPSNMEYWGGGGGDKKVGEVPCAKQLPPLSICYATQSRQGLVLQAPEQHGILGGTKVGEVP